MTDSSPQSLGFPEVFADELVYLHGRWREAYGDVSPRAAAPRSHHRPSTRRELVGLALSGGGLGSSTFQLGAIESLDRAGVFDHVDYLSTVSSGGFIGSSVSTAMRKGGEFPFRERSGGRPSPHLSWLRSGLADTGRSGVVNDAGSFGSLLRGMLINLLILLPILMVFGVGLAQYQGNLLAVWEAADRQAAQAQEVAALAAEEAAWAEKRAIGGDRVSGWPAAVRARERADAAARAAETSRTAWQRAGAELGGPWRATPWIAGTFLLSVLVFPVLINVSRAYRQGKAEDSSARSRTVAEKAFGFLVVLTLATYLFEALPLLLRSFHRTAAIPYRFWYALAVVLGALALAVAVGKRISRLSGLRQVISLLLVGLLFLMIALTVVFFIAEFLIYPVEISQPTAAAGATTAMVAMQTTPLPAYRAAANALRLKKFSPELGMVILALFIGSGLAAIGFGKLPRSRLRSALIPIGIAIGALIGFLGLVGLSFALASLSVTILTIEGIRPDLAMLAAAMAILYFCSAIDVNTTSPLGLYRDRLAKLYLIGVRAGKGGKGCEAFVEPDYEMSELCGGDQEASKAPFHLLNAAVNLQGSKDLVARRSHGAFIFSKHYCGGEHTGYCRSEQLERVFPQLDLQTAMAVSGAGISPNASRLTRRSMVAMMTLLNVRLGYWVPNPGRLSAWLHRRSRDIPLRDRLRWGKVSVLAFLREICGAVNEHHRFVNLSDGGNVDDTGAFELLRRRCKYVIVVDGTVDPDHSFGSLIRLRRRAQRDLGVDIELSLEGLRLDRDRQTRRHAAAGRILYPPAEEGGEPETGLLLYLRPSLTGDEDDLITERRAHSPDFPHESEAAEGLDDRQFSAHRALGLHSVEGLFETPVGDQASPALDFRGFKEWFQGLDERLTPKGIFISYRRADASGHALLIHKALEKRFPNAELFLDVGGIEPGEEFTSAIAETLDRSRITLVLIGNQWLGLTSEGGARRLDDPEDTVRSEISMSLAKGKRVIPLLVEQTPMPREQDLPEELRPLAYQNAVNLTHDRFDSDLETLIRILETFLD